MKNLASETIKPFPENQGMGRTPFPKKKDTDEPNLVTPYPENQDNIYYKKENITKKD
jgi:hypothetical protein